MWFKNIWLLLYIGLLVNRTNANVERKGDVGQQRHVRAPQPDIFPKPRGSIPYINRTLSITAITPSPKTYATSIFSSTSTDDGTDLDLSVLIHPAKTSLTIVSEPVEVEPGRVEMVGWSRSMASLTTRTTWRKRPAPSSGDPSISSTSTNQHPSVSPDLILSRSTSIKQHNNTETPTGVKVSVGLWAISTPAEQSTPIQTHSPHDNQTSTSRSGPWRVSTLTVITTTAAPLQRSTLLRAQPPLHNRTSAATSTRHGPALETKITSKSMVIEVASPSSTKTENISNASPVSQPSVTHPSYSNKTKSTISGSGSFPICTSARGEVLCRPRQLTDKSVRPTHFRTSTMPSGTHRTSSTARTSFLAAAKSTEVAKENPFRTVTSMRTSQTPSSTGRPIHASKTSRTEPESLPSATFVTPDPSNSSSGRGMTGTLKVSVTTTTREIQTSSLNDSKPVNGSFSSLLPVYNTATNVPTNGTGKMSMAMTSTGVDQVPTSTSQTTENILSSKRSSTTSVSVTESFTSNRSRPTGTSGISRGISATTINTSILNGSGTTIRKSTSSEKVAFSTTSPSLPLPSSTDGVLWGYNTTTSTTSVTSDHVLLAPIKSTSSEAGSRTSTLASAEPTLTAELSLSYYDSASTASITSDEILLKPSISTSGFVTSKTTTRSVAPSDTPDSYTSATDTAKSTSESSSSQDFSTTNLPNTSGLKLSRTSQAPSTSATGFGGIPDIPEIPRETEDPPLTKSQSVGVAVGGTACLLFALVAAMIVSRRYQQKGMKRKSGGSVYPEIAYLYDPPIPRGGDDDDFESGNRQFLSSGAAPGYGGQKLGVPENTPASTNNGYNTPNTSRPNMAYATHQERCLQRTTSAPEISSSAQGPSDASGGRYRQLQVNPHDQATNPVAENYPPMSPYDKESASIPLITRPRTASSMKSPASKESNRVSGGIWWHNPPQVDVDPDQDVLLNVDIRSSTPDSALLVLGPQRPQSKASASLRPLPLSPLKQTVTQPASIDSSCKGKAPIRDSPVYETPLLTAFPLPPTPGFKHSPSTANTTPLLTPPHRTMSPLPEHKGWDDIKLDEPDENGYKLTTTTSANSYPYHSTTHYHQSLSSISESASSSLFPPPLNLRQSYPASSSSSPAITINGRATPHLRSAQRRPPPLSGNGMILAGRARAPAGLGLHIPGWGFGAPLRTAFQAKGKGRQSWGVDQIRADPVVEEKRRSELAFADPALVGRRF